jgi:hypothetical protein
MNLGKETAVQPPVEILPSPVAAPPPRGVAAVDIGRSGVEFWM